VRASLAEWAPGSMRITLDGREERVLYLLVGETWYPDWHASVDGKDAVVHRGDHALLTVELPPGAREVRLHFASARYALGKVVTLVALVVIAGLFVWSARRARRPVNG
ncbi:MAG TPA: hypothetical protein VFT84_16450, partial [Gemmatimonadales bacterium]|nr:hypothetical protein [Gemmatimonadales bacterium]